jgi:biopolymer transport protein ExbD
MSGEPARLRRTRARRTRTIVIPSVRETQAEINVTPLIDVVLVLLIIFMVMTPLVERDLAIQLSTDKRTSDPSQVEPKQVLVAVDGSGKLHINSEPVSPAQYVDELKRLLRGRSPDEQVVFVVASDGTNYASLVEAIDRAKQAGATTVGLATELPP